MRHGLHLNGSTPPKGVELNPRGFTPPKPVEIFAPRHERLFSPNPDSRPHPVHFDSNRKTPTVQDRMRNTHCESRCGGCGRLETRVLELEEELRMTNLRMEEFQHEIVGHLARLSDDVRGLTVPRTQPSSSRYSDTSSLVPDRPSMATPSVRQDEFESHLKQSVENPEHVIAEACVQLERLVADAKSRLYT